MRLNKRAVISFFLAFCYVGVGTLELFGIIRLSNYLDALSDGLDLYILYPSYIFGSVFWWLFGGEEQYILSGMMGQSIGLVLFYFFFYFTLGLFIKDNNYFFKN